jgi:hypothetical protein
MHPDPLTPPPALLVSAPTDTPSESPTTAPSFLDYGGSSTAAPTRGIGSFGPTTSPTQRATGGRPPQRKRSLWPIHRNHVFIHLHSTLPIPDVPSAHPIPPHPFPEFLCALQDRPPVGWRRPPARRSPASPPQPRPVKRRLSPRTPRPPRPSPRRNRPHSRVNVRIRMSRGTKPASSVECPQQVLKGRRPRPPGGCPGCSLSRPPLCHPRPAPPLPPLHPAAEREVPLAALNQRWHQRPRLRADQPSNRPRALGAVSSHPPRPPAAQPRPACFPARRLLPQILGCQRH